eukprot:g6435.t1
MFFQDGLTGSAWGDWANYTASPLRAFENELGVQAPVGFFDPFGLTKDGDVEAFKRRRATELKNGRVAMLATMGYIVPEYFRFPGLVLRYCSPTEGVKFADVPNGLAALGKVPAAGWTQIFLFLGLVEKGIYTYDPTRSPGDFKSAGVLGAPNGSTMNGRVAMFATMGFILPEYFRFPGYLSPAKGLKFADVPNGLAALSKVPLTGWIQIFLFCGMVDFGLYRQTQLNAGILGVPNASGPMSDAEGRKRKLNSELANGRLAMVAITGMLFQNGSLLKMGTPIFGHIFRRDDVLNFPHHHCRCCRCGCPLQWRQLCVCASHQQSSSHCVYRCRIYSQPGGCSWQNRLSSCRWCSCGSFDRQWS